MGKRKIKPMKEISADESKDDKGTAVDGSDGKSGSKGARKLRHPPFPPVGEPSGSDKASAYPTYLDDARQTSRPKAAGIIMIVVALIIFFNAFVSLTFDIDKRWDNELFSSLNRSGKISVEGTVYGENNEPLENVTVMLKDAGMKTITDKDGKYIFMDAPFGKQRMIVSKFNYTIVDHRVFIEGPFDKPNQDVIIKIDFYLEPGNGTMITGNYSSSTISLVKSVYRTCGILSIIAGTLIIPFAILSIKRRKFSLVAVGCIIGIIFGLQLLYIATILSIIALVLAYLSRNEYRK